MSNRKKAERSELNRRVWQAELGREMAEKQRETAIGALIVANRFINTALGLLNHAEDKDD